MDPFTIALATLWVVGGTFLANAQLNKPKRKPKPPIPGHSQADIRPR